MRSTANRPHPLAMLAALAIALVLTLGLSACGAAGTRQPPKPTATAKPTATPVPRANVVEIAKTQHFADSKSGGTTSPCANGDPLISGDCGVTVTAACPSGEPVLSGGYTLDDPLAFVSSSYPSGAGTWTITAHDEGQDGGSHPVTVTAYADCLQANFAAATQSVTTTPNVPADSIQTFSVSCPQGTVVTGGGYRGSNGGITSAPSGDGWQAVLNVQMGSAARPMLFAVCAGNHLAAASVPSALKTYSPGNTNGEVAVACPQGQLLVGGGVKGQGPGFLLTVAATSDVSHWHVLVDGPNSFEAGPGVSYTATAYAVCVTVV